MQDEQQGANGTPAKWAQKVVGVCLIVSLAGLALTVGLTALMLFSQIDKPTESLPKLTMQGIWLSGSFALLTGVCLIVQATIFKKARRSTTENHEDAG